MALWVPGCRIERGFPPAQGDVSTAGDLGNTQRGQSRKEGAIRNKRRENQQCDKRGISTFNPLTQPAACAEVLT